MSIKDSVLTFLENSRGEPISGAAIAEKLQVSRNSVWKAINQLKAEGYMIEAATNRGYTLASSNDLLSTQSIMKYITCPEPLQIQVFPTIDSTNTQAKKYAAEGEGEGTIIISEEQTAGRGRLGRVFASPKKTGIYMSILLRPKFSAQEALSITTSAAVAVAKAIESVSGKGTKIKWVNDVYIEEKKICGILTEASLNFENGGLEYAVLGIGINVKTPEGGFPEEIKDIAGAVYDYECGDDVRSKISAAVINNFFGYYRTLPDNSYIKEYRSRSLLTGREVSYTLGDTEETGIVIGIDDEARLLIKLSDGSTKVFSAGEVSLKKSFLKNS